METNAIVEMKANDADLTDVLSKRIVETGLAFMHGGYPMLCEVC